MLTMGQQQYITGLEKFKGLSLRGICRETGYHFYTVKKYADKEDWNEEIKPRKIKGSKLDILKPIIDEWLKTDFRMPRKQRHTGTRVYDRLKSENETKDLLLVGRQIVINYVTKTKRELCKSVYDTAILGDHPSGQAQVDFGEVYVFNHKGLMVKRFELIVSFPYSNGAYTLKGTRTSAEAFSFASRKTQNVCLRQCKKYLNIWGRFRLEYCLII